MSQIIEKKTLYNSETSQSEMNVEYVFAYRKSSIFVDFKIVIQYNNDNYALSKLSKGKDVSTEVLGKICETLNFTIDDIMEFVPKQED